MNQYDRRDKEDLGELFTRHLTAMTDENLYMKGDIAAELAWRDKCIADLGGKLRLFEAQLRELLHLTKQYVGFTHDALGQEEVVETERFLEQTCQPSIAERTALSTANAKIERLRNAAKPVLQSWQDSGTVGDDPEMDKDFEHLRTVLSET